MDPKRFANLLANWITLLICSGIFGLFLVAVTCCVDFINWAHSLVLFEAADAHKQVTCAPSCVLRLQCPARGTQTRKRSRKRIPCASPSSRPPATTRPVLYGLLHLISRPPAQPVAAAVGHSLTHSPTNSSIHSYAFKLPALPQACCCCCRAQAKVSTCPFVKSIRSRPRANCEQHCRKHMRPNTKTDSILIDASERGRELLFLLVIHYLVGDCCGNKRRILPRAIFTARNLDRYLDLTDIRIQTRSQAPGSWKSSIEKTVEE